MGHQYHTRDETIKMTKHSQDPHDLRVILSEYILNFEFPRDAYLLLITIVTAYLLLKLFRLSIRLLVSIIRPVIFVILILDQYRYGSISHQQQPQSIGATPDLSQAMYNAVSSAINTNVLHTLPNGVSIDPDAQLLQTQIQQIKQQQQQKMLHNALTRTISHQPTSTDIQLLQSNLEAISATECHRKLERTQSEPAPQINSQVNTSRYKTELCRPFKETGECKYVEKCQFAHGENELRTVQRHPKYKTEYCRTFCGVGLCPYGSRCHFLHDLSGEDDTTRTRGTNGNRADGNVARQFIGNKDDSVQMPNRHASHPHGYNRNMTSAEVDAITKSARYITAVKEEPIQMSNRSYGRNATILNSNTVGAVHPLPMSPPLSMSTGSDRASPICSLSPTNSIASFPFTEPSTLIVNTVNTMQNGIYSSSSLHITPPASPPAMIAGTPPPTPILVNTNKSNAINANGMSNAEKRLPIFNQISCASTIETLKNLPL